MKTCEDAPRDLQITNAALVEMKRVQNAYQTSEQRGRSQATKPRIDRVTSPTDDRFSAHAQLNHAFDPLLTLDLAVRSFL